MRYRVPEWYRDAKLGIMVHWGVPTVPAYAPVEHGGLVEILRDHDWGFFFRNNPYAEWYLNSIRIPDSPAHAYHRRHFGGQPYERLARRFNEDLEKWDPSLWAELFAETGARYVVMVGKHHDGYLMWPSGETPPGENLVASRDVVGELGDAVREKGLKYGIYYSGLLDWTVQPKPITELADMLLARTPSAYERYAQAHLHELIDRYSPDLLWNDIGLPAGISKRELFAAYREAVPDGVLNDRWRQTGSLARWVLSSPPGRRRVAAAARRAILRGASAGGKGDVRTVEYADVTTLRSRPWELVRGLGRSFCYNAAEPRENYLSGTELIHTLVDVVAKNGNLLLNVAPRADGTISADQLTALTSLAEWLRDYGEAIYGTRPWHVAEGETGKGVPVRYTAKEDALYAILLGRPRMLSVSIRGIDLRKVPRRKRARGEEDELVVRLLGSDREVDWHMEGDAVIVDIPGSFVPTDAPVVKFSWERAGERRPANFYTDVI